MKLLALDPSSTRTGYAVFGRQERTEALREAWELVDAGYLTPPNRGAIERILVMRDDLVDLAVETEAEAIVIEVPSGHVARRLHGNAAGLSVYGMAVGVMLGVFGRSGTVRRIEDGVCGGSAAAPLVYPVEENDWTQSVPKKKRQIQVALEFPQYREAMARDGGADVADAIGLGRWVIGRMKLEAVA